MLAPFRRFSILSSRALVFEQHGRPESVLKVKNIPLKPTDQSVIVRILAAPVNPSDINIIEGLDRINEEHIH